MRLFVEQHTHDLRKRDLETNARLYDHIRNKECPANHSRTHQLVGLFFRSVAEVSGESRGGNQKESYP